MATRSLRSYLTQEKKFIGVGMVLYFLSLAIVLVIVTGLIINYGGSIFGPFPFDLLVVEIIFAFPAIPSSFIASYLSKNKFTGIFTIGLSGFIVISLLSLIIGIVLLGEVLGPPPVDHYEEFGRRMLILFIIFFYLFFILPTAGISAVFAALFGLVGSKKLLFFLKPNNRDKLINYKQT